MVGDSACSTFSLRQTCDISPYSFRTDRLLCSDLRSEFLCLQVVEHYLSKQYAKTAVRQTISQEDVGVLRNLMVNWMQRLSQVLQFLGVFLKDLSLFSATKCRWHYATRWRKCSRWYSSQTISRTGRTSSKRRA